MIWIMLIVFYALVLSFVVGALTVAGRADDAALTDDPREPTDSTEPRCDVTGTRLTVRERFERECG